MAPGAPGRGREAGAEQPGTAGKGRAWLQQAASDPRHLGRQWWSCRLFLGCAAGEQPGRGRVACSAAPGPAPGRISGALPPWVRSGVSVRSASRAWGAARRGGHQCRGDTGMGWHPVPMGEQSLCVQTLVRASPRWLCPQDQGSKLRLSSLLLPDPLLTAVLLLSPSCCPSSSCSAGALPWSFPVPGAAECDAVVHTASAALGTGAAHQGQGLLAAAGASHGCSRHFPAAGGSGGGTRDGKLAASREGSGKNELKPRKMRPRWRVGGEAGGGCGEALGSEGRKESGGTGGGRGLPAAPAGPAPGAGGAGARQPQPPKQAPSGPSWRPPSIPGWQSALLRSPPVLPSAACPVPSVPCVPLCSPPPRDKGPRWLVAVLGCWPRRRPRPSLHTGPAPTGCGDAAGFFTQFPHSVHKDIAGACGKTRSHPAGSAAPVLSPVPASGQPDCRHAEMDDGPTAARSSSSPLARPP